MKKAIIVLFLIVTALWGHAQNDSAYIYTYGGIQNDVCNQIIPTRDGGYIMIGTTNSFGCGNTSLYVVKTDSLCNHEWSKTYGGNLNQAGYSVAATPDHGYAFLGFTDSYGNGGYDVYLVKTDSAGKVQWQKTYGGSDWDFGYSIKETPTDSGFIICGTTYSYGSGNGDVYAIKTDKNGDTLWTRAIGGTGYDAGNAVCVTKDSLYTIIGATTSFGIGIPDTNAYFIQLNNKGIIKKDTTYGSTHSDIGYSINPTLDHGFVIYGSSDSIQPDKPDEIIIKTDSIGKMQWMHVFGSADIGIGRDAVQMPDTTYITVGTNNSYGLGGYAMHIQRLSAGGWYIVGPSYGGTGDEEGKSVAVGKNGNVVFAGASNSIGNTVGLNDMYVVRLKTDSVFNIANYDSLPYYQFKDTCFCILGVNSLSAPQVLVKLFPNPVLSQATILVQGTLEGCYLLSIYNSTGKCVMQNIPLHSTYHNQYVIHFERGNLVSGVYFYKVDNKKGFKMAYGKFIIE